MTERAPLVSVGVPVYNGERYLAGALDALAAQDLEDFEVVICDNASTDATAEIAREYAARDGRFSYHRNQRNLGLSGNFNRTFELSRGRYFKWAAHDDWHPPQALRLCAEALEGDPSAVLCGSAVAIMDDDGEVFDRWHPTADLRSPNPRVRLHRLIWTLDETHPLFALMRSDALRRTPGYRPYVAADRVLLSQLVLMGPFWQLPDVLHYYRAARMRPGASWAPDHPSQAAILDPNRTRLPSRTWRLCYEHLRLVSRARLAPQDKLLAAADVLGRFGVRDSRRLAAEAYHSGRILAARALSRAT
ncbi:MAG TPA: glycosyltransferase family 2 protein [Actinomycetes bacterium]|nr:glycosyltransferase family 2 protein [Actinomycetes bacterium]